MPNISANIFVDNMLIGTIPFNLGSDQENVLGDGGGRGEGTAEITSYSIVQNTIPEPSTVPLFSTGLVGLLWYGWRRRKRLA